MLSESIAAIFDCSVAEISFVFTGHTHNEVIDLEDDTFDWVCEIDRLLCIYESEDVKGPVDEDGWIERAREPGKVYFGFPEYMLAAAVALTAIFDTYAQEEYLSHTTTLVDHQGNRSPLDIERK